MTSALRLDRLFAVALTCVALVSSPGRAAASNLVYPGEWDMAPALVRVVFPAAPESDDDGGLVIVKIEVSEDGAVTYAGAQLGPKGLRKPAEEAARAWHYTSLKAGGNPVRAQVLVSFVYVPEEKLYYVQGPRGAYYAPPGVSLALGANGELPADAPKEAGIVEIKPGDSTRKAPQRVSGGVMAGKAKNRPQPAYPEAAKISGVQGEAVVEVLVGKTGYVIFARPVDGHDLLRPASTLAARQWTFSPTTLGGSPVVVMGTISFHFRARR